MPLVPGAVRLRAVLDTNIYTAAFEYPKGRTAGVWAAAIEGRYQFLVSPAIIREVAEVNLKTYADIPLDFRRTLGLK